jgi:hypothetical protein
MRARHVVGRSEVRRVLAGVDMAAADRVCTVASLAVNSAISHTVHSAPEPEPSAHGQGLEVWLLADQRQLEFDHRNERIPRLDSTIHLSTGG